MMLVRPDSHLFHPVALASAMPALLERVDRVLVEIRIVVPAPPAPALAEAAV